MYLFEVLLVDATEGDGVATEVEDELAVAVDADDVALVAGEDASEDAELDMVAGELLEGVAEEGDALRVVAQHRHEGLHHRIRYRCGGIARTVFYKMVLGIIETEESLEVTGGALQEHEAADGGLELFLHAPTLGFLLVAIGAMNKTGMGCVGMGSVVSVHLTLKDGHGHVVEVEVAPGQFLFATVRSLYTQVRCIISLGNVYALW